MTEQASRALPSRARIVVVGGGGAGLAAAITARELGRSVILIEKNPQIGGSTTWAVGT